MPRYGKLALMGFGLLTLMACSRLQAITEINRDLPPAQDSLRQIDDNELHSAVLRALIRTDWDVEGQSPHRILARKNFRQHSAAITVDYSRSNYKIVYRDSQELGYENGKIHRRYNALVTQLDRAIYQEWRVTQNLGQASPTP